MTFPVLGPALVALLVAVHLFSGKLKFLERLPRSRWLSAAGGSSVAYVFVHLLPELAHAQSLLGKQAEGTDFAAIETHIYLIALVGLVLFYGLQQVMSSSAARRDMVTTPRLFWLHLSTFAVYSIIIGYLLIQGEDRTPAALATYGIAMALHMIVVDVGLRLAHGQLYHDKGRWVLAAMPILGAGLALTTDISELAILSMVAFLGGGVILNVLKEELPEDRQSSFAAFLAGTAGYTVLLLLAT
ncbi:hypothetical protein KCG44_07570 [Pacificimonas sp. WHA3]|uniref:ZIP Zinc transporter n=1 Tax=Pacificimonas pallii TaxID=2827236 RepID=A0ABS6SDZ7_9SPHN|nr:hypothetical protein [Pacificimonas pallii]MBV7256642.1 hypothetical protein [Pacificimonas pallii]